MSLRIIFMGTPEFSVPTLSEIIARGHEVVAVYSQPPRPAGRGMELRKSPVHEKAEEFGIPVFTPVSLKGEAEQKEFASFNADVAVVVAYGLLLPQVVLDAPRLGCYNGHASLLPRWRGAAPIQRAIMAGDSETGVMVMKMEAGLDTGPMGVVEKVTIAPDMSAGELHDALSVTSGGLMVRALDALEQGNLKLTEQSKEGITYAKKIEKTETRIDWSKPVVGVHNHIRGLSPFPGAWCEMVLGGKNTRVKVLRAKVVDGNGTPGEVLDDALTISCEGGALRLERVQKAGKQAGSAEEFLRGNPVSKGTVLT
ncbi:MAG: methionyl-tRNA formyltransferase [Hyphomicrobiales bacterium]|nr:MAG: methionyl-tRNA formyltransferase [Hyphomicrobiales bacterium]